VSAGLAAQRTLSFEGGRVTLPTSGSEAPADSYCEQHQTGKREQVVLTPELPCSILVLAEYSPLGLWIHPLWLSAAQSSQDSSQLRPS